MCRAQSVVPTVGAQRIQWIEDHDVYTQCSCSPSSVGEDLVG